MWIAHYASGLIAKPFVPAVPLSLLCLAGAMPDVTFLVLNFLGLESFSANDKLAKRGCFPYVADYKYSHSLVGMVIIGIGLALAYKLTSKRHNVPPKDLAIIAAVSISHFLLEVPSHRKDIKITPNDSVKLGRGLFDKPTTLFTVETVLFFIGLWVYTAFAPLTTKSGYKNNTNILGAVVAFMIAQQAYFCFGATSTYEIRWVHVPTFLVEILGSCWALGKLEG